MFEFIAGIAVGAAFSPFWLAAWSFVKSKLPFKAKEDHDLH